MRVKGFAKKYFRACILMPFVRGAFVSIFCTKTVKTRFYRYIEIKTNVTKPLF